MKLTFTKMHAMGNDFIILDRLVGGEMPDFGEIARKLCLRHFSIAFLCAGFVKEKRLKSLDMNS